MVIAFLLQEAIFGSQKVGENHQAIHRINL